MTEIFTSVRYGVPFLAIVLFGLFAFFAYKHRRHPILWIGLLGIGSILGDWILLCGINNNLNPLHILEAFQMGTLDAGYSEFAEKISLAGNTQDIDGKALTNFDGFYRGIFYIFSCITPLIFAGFFLSFFKSIYDELRYYFKGKLRDTYVFSEINENSFALACDIRAHEKRAMIIFCQNDIEESMLLTKIYRNNFVLLKRHITKFAIKSNFKRYFFALCENEDKNFQILQELIAEYKKIKFEQSDNPNKVKIFVQNENFLPELAMDSRPRELKTVTVTFINKSETAANELLFKKPLYIACDKNSSVVNNINMLIVGTTPCADKVLRLAVSSSQMGENYSAKFIVCDKNAFAYREKLLRKAPELFLPEYKIEFYNVDVETNSFKEFLDEKCGDVNYIAVCVGNDNLNFETSLFMRSYFIRKNPEKETMPFIGVYLQETGRSMIETLVATQKETYDLFAFGKSRDAFSYELLVNSELEKLALNVHACYSYDKNADVQESIQTRIQSYNRSETDRKSNRANALHIKYKLHALGYEIKLKSQATSEEIQQSKILAREFVERLSNKNVLDGLAKIEHARWNAHERSDGWVFVSKENSKLHQERTRIPKDENNEGYKGTHKFNVAKMHPCLCSWNELEGVGELIKGNPEAYKKYDRQICEFLPSILGLEENRAINISNVEYVLIKNKSSKGV